MTIVDTSSVWVRFSVYQKDLARLEPGQQVTVDLGQGFAQASGTIEYISPLIDPQTRTAQARLELDNPQGTLRPGLYVEVRVDAGADAAAIVVPRDAVQVLDGENIVFVPAEEGFAAQPVELGRSDRDNAVILSGLEAGQPYVRKGAFELKAKIVTSGLDPHAGHGH